MRILHILDHSLPLQSGYVFRTLGILNAQRGRGWSTIQLTTPRNHFEDTDSETVDGWRFYRTPPPRGWVARRPVLREVLEMRATTARINEVIARERPDILHAHSPVLNAIPALRAGHRAGLPVVYEVRALWEDAAVDLGTSRPHGMRYKATKALETRALHKADAVVTLCQAMRTELIGRGVPEQRIAVVPNAVDLAHFTAPQPPDPALAARLGLAGRVVLGFIGSFYHYEGLDLLLHAMPKLHEALPNVTLLLVGGGPQEEQLKAQAARLGLGTVVHFTGRVPHETVRSYYDLVDFFVYPRRSMRLTELVTPLKPLEAMAESRIVLASDVGGHRELIEDGVTGFLFRADDPDDLVRCVLGAVAAPDWLARMRVSGRHFVEMQRTWAASAAAYEPIYERLVIKKALPQAA